MKLTLQAKKALLKTLVAYMVVYNSL